MTTTPNAMPSSKKRLALWTLGLSAALSLVVFGLAAPRALSARTGDVRSFNLHTVEIAGTKFWLPSTLIVKKGERVRVRITSKVPGANSVHGFAIDDFNIQEIADPKGKELEFVADKAGLFTIRCHLHPAHVGGQLLVTE